MQSLYSILFGTILHPEESVCPFTLVYLVYGSSPFERFEPHQKRYQSPRVEVEVEVGGGLDIHMFATRTVLDAVHV